MDPANIQNLSTESTTPVPPVPTPASSVQPPISTPPPPAPKIKWGKGALVGSLIGITVLVGGIFAGMSLYQNKLRSSTKAWSGFVAKRNASEMIYYRLKGLYPSAIQKDGVYMYYDENTKKTFIFARFENISSPPTGKVVQVWLVKSSVDLYSVLGVAEVAQGNPSAAYLVATRDGKVGDYFDKLIVSHDSPALLTKPETPLLTVDLK